MAYSFHLVLKKKSNLSLKNQMQYPPVIYLLVLFHFETLIFYIGMDQDNRLKLKIVHLSHFDLFI